MLGEDNLSSTEQDFCQVCTEPLLIQARAWQARSGSPAQDGAFLYGDLRSKARSNRFLYFLTPFSSQASFLLR